MKSPKLCCSNRPASTASRVGFVVVFFLAIATIAHSRQSQAQIEPPKQKAPSVLDTASGAGGGEPDTDLAPSPAGTTQERDGERGGSEGSSVMQPVWLGGSQPEAQSASAKSPSGTEAERETGGPSASSAEGSDVNDASVEPMASVASSGVEPAEPVADNLGRETSRAEPSVETEDVTWELEGWSAVNSVTQMPSYLGSVGLLRLSTAEAGEVGSLRIGLHGEFFSANDVLITDDQNTRLKGSFSLGYTPIEGLDVFLSLLGGSNQNRRLCRNGVCVSEPERRDPEIIKSFGDVVLGGKYAHPLGEGLSVGGQAYLQFLSSVSGVSLDPSATSVSLKALGSFDGKQSTLRLPIRGHLNLGYLVDNSSGLQDFSGVSQATELVSSFAFGVAENRFQMGLGVDVPVPVAGDAFAVLPFAEYHAEVVTSAANSRFEEFLPPACGQSVQQPCRDNRDQHWVALGAKASIWGGATVALALELALRSVGFPYGPPLAPYNVVFGVSVPLEFAARSRATKIVTRSVTGSAVASVQNTGVVAGFVTDAQTETPVDGATVAILGRSNTRVATDPDGSFTSHELPPGAYELEISATGYASRVIRAEVASGMSTDVALPLEPKPVTVALTGRLVDEQGTPIGEGRVLIDGETEAFTSEAGTFSVELVPGPHIAIADTPGYLRKGVRFVVAESFLPQVELRLAKIPEQKLVRVAADALKLGRPLAFEKQGDVPSARLMQLSLSILDEVTDILLGNPGLRVLEIRTHWDNALGDDEALRLTSAQADAIADYLREQGVAVERLRTAPMGAGKPLVPNLGRQNRLKNQRVEFAIVER